MPSKRRCKCEGVAVGSEVEVADGPSGGQVTDRSADKPERGATLGGRGQRCAQEGSIIDLESQMERT